MGSEASGQVDGTPMMLGCYSNCDQKLLKSCKHGVKLSNWHF